MISLIPCLTHWKKILIYFLHWSFLYLGVNSFRQEYGHFNRFSPMGSEDCPITCKHVAILLQENAGQCLLWVYCMSGIILRTINGINWFIPHKLLLLTLFDRWGNWGTKWLSNLHKLENLAVASNKKRH